MDKNLLCVFVCLLVTITNLDAKGSKRPHVVVIIADDLVGIFCFEGYIFTFKITMVNFFSVIKFISFSDVKHFQTTED